NKMNKIRSEKNGRADSVDSVHSVEKPLPNSKKIYVNGKLHPDIRAPFREISLAPTKSMNGAIEVNEPVHVYDTSGPWSDPDYHARDGIHRHPREWHRLTACELEFFCRGSCQLPI